MKRDCRSCGRQIQQGIGWGNVSFNHGITTIEHLQNWTGQMLLCADCANVLRTWLGMEPFTQPTAEELEAMPTEPYSCFDERLRYQRD